MGDYPCVGLYTRYYIHDPTIVHCLQSYVNVTKLLKINVAAKRPFCNFLLPNVHQVIGWHSWVYLPNQKRPNGNIFLKRANEHFFVSGHSNLRVSDIGIKMAQKNPQWYVMARWSMSYFYNK